MRDQFRTLLVNEAFANYSDGIATGFHPVTLPTSMQNFYNVLFPVGSAHNYKLFLADNFTKIIEAAGLEDGMLVDDPRVTFTLPDAQFFYAGSPYYFDFGGFYQTLLLNKAVIDKMLSVPSRHKDTSFENYWTGHHNPVYKVAGLILAYVDRIPFE